MRDDVLFSRDSHERYVLGERFIGDHYGGGMSSNIASHPFELARKVDQLAHIWIIVVEFLEICTFFERALDGYLGIVWNQFADFYHATEGHA